MQPGQKDVLFMGPSTGTAQDPCALVRTVGSLGHFALALKIDVWTSSLSFETTYLKLEHSLHNGHWQPCSILEFWHSSRYNKHPEHGGFILVLNFLITSIGLSNSKFSWNMSCPTLGRNSSHPLIDNNPWMSSSHNMYMAKVTEVNRKNTSLFALGRSNHEMSKH